MIATGTWPGFVARVATPATPAEIAQQLTDAWPAVVGCEVSGGELQACLAQILLETGTRANLDEQHQAPGYWNGNSGNLRGEYAGQWTSFTAGEGHGASAVILAPGPNNRFRSYLGPEDDTSDPEALERARALGVRDYIGLLARKYPAALAAARANNFTGYVHALHLGGYFTASETAYASTEDRLRQTIQTLPLVAAYVGIPQH